MIGKYVSILSCLCIAVLLLATFCAPTLAETLFSEDFSKGADRWEPGSGDWVVKDGAYVQTTTDFFTASWLKKEHWDDAWTEYTLELRAKKLDGAEGFSIVFGIRQDNTPVVKDDRKDFFDFLVAGWTNTRTLIRKIEGGTWTNFPHLDHSVEPDKWYDVKVEVTPQSVVCYLDGEKMVEQAEGPPSGRIGLMLLGTSSAFDDIVVYDAGGPSIAVLPMGKLTTRWGDIKSLEAW